MLLSLLFHSACQPQDGTAPAPQAAPQQPLGYLALGDSYTIGHDVPEKERFPEQLADSLRATGLDMAPPRIVAKTGWTTGELQAGIAAANDLKARYGLVSLLIGVNNQYRGHSIEVYKQEFTALLNQAIAFAGGNKERVFVVSIPDYAYTPFGKGKLSISQGIDAFNAANRAITEQAGAAYFNITPISREGTAHPALVAADGLHPSGQQYARWVGLMIGEVKKML